MHSYILRWVEKKKKKLDKNNKPPLYSMSIRFRLLFLFFRTTVTATAAASATCKSKARTQFVHVVESMLLKKCVRCECMDCVIGFFFFFCTHLHSLSLKFNTVNTSERILNLNSHWENIHAKENERDGSCITKFYKYFAIEPHILPIAFFTQPQRYNAKPSTKSALFSLSLTHSFTKWLQLS